LRRLRLIRQSQSKKQPERFAVLRERIETERLQLISHWKKVVLKRPNLTVDRFSQVALIALGTPAVLPSRTLSDSLRKFHNTLGYQAWGTPEIGGVCAGTIFRTEQFINTEIRVGEKFNKSVHIEHTVPIFVLQTELRKRCFSSYTEALVWLLKHSVTTAFHQSETSHLKGVSKSSHAFDYASPHYEKPFSRYRRLFVAGGQVWNVYDRELVSPDQFGFDSHIQIIFRLFAEAGADRALLADLEKHL
jgi:hypothetical protein